MRAIPAVRITAIPATFFPFAPHALPHLSSDAGFTELRGRDKPLPLLGGTRRRPDSLDAPTAGTWYRT